MDADAASRGDANVGLLGEGGVPEDGGTAEGRDPIDCDEARSTHSYVGCDYWPTITPNVVDAAFDFVVVVANTGATSANVTVTGPQGTNRMVAVAPGELRKIYLPWVDDLKATASRAQTLVVPGGGYHIVSTSPVIVYQFNPLEYDRKGGEAPGGGPKVWPACNPAYESCASYANDASLLLPSTAMTGNYRITSYPGWTGQFLIGKSSTVAYPPVLSITATAPQTTVKVQLSSSASVEASAKGQTIGATDGGGTLSFVLANAGDVAQLVGQGADDSDFSGSVVQASKPVQVIASAQATQIPKEVITADHIEETVMPAETLGKQYVIAAPTGFDSKPAKHLVRFYGNADNTALVYAPAKPTGCPDTLAAGQVADCGVVGDSFVVSGNAEFGVATFLVASSYYGTTLGDPSQTSHPAIEQYRKSYVFLAPTDFPVLWADVTAPADTTLQLDGVAVTAPWTPIVDGKWGVVRLDLTKSGKDGAHTLTSSNPVAVDVLGYATFASFEYPAGLNLNLIAPPPGIK